jgi:3D (Asp-Asp-Asp) domain-containing protein
VLGQAHTPRRRIAPLAAVALAVLAAPAVSSAITSHGASALRAHDAALAAKSRAAVLGLYSLDQRLSAAQTRLASLQAQQAALRGQRADVARQLTVARRSMRLAQSRLAARLRMLYEQGNVEPLEIVFGSKTLDEALSSLDNLSRVTGQGEDVLREVEAARTDAAGAARRLAAQSAALAAAAQQAQATATALAQTRAARNAYIGSLAAQRRLTQRQIASVVSQAAAARARSQELTPPPAATSLVAATAAAPVVAAGGRTLTVSATGYSLPGRTATGLPVGWGVVAVDPSLIPLGTHMTIPGYGEAVAADTGGAVIGASIDLWFPSAAQANAWGRRTVTIVLH